MDPTAAIDAQAGTMRAVRLAPPGGIDGLSVEELPIPDPEPGDALVRVRAAALTRGELDWPVDRLPATPSYELSGEVVAVGPAAGGATVGDAVFGLSGFDRDGAAAEYAAVRASYLALRPRTLSDVESAALPLAGLSAWQGLFVHGRLEPGQRVLIHGASGGVGHLAVQLAHWRGAYVIGTAAGPAARSVASLGAHQVVDRAAARFQDAVEPVDLVFDTVGGETLAGSADVLREGGRLVSVAEEPPADVAKKVTSLYFVVEPDGGQLVELARLADEGTIRPAIDRVFPLADARSAFERVAARGKHGKVVIEVGHA
jgi:NADPH:quinone reductase-like Zn-dependent oxidoreductase